MKCWQRDIGWSQVLACPRFPFHLLLSLQSILSPALMLPKREMLWCCRWKYKIDFRIKFINIQGSVSSNNGMTQNRAWSCQTWHDLVTQGSNEGCGAAHCSKTPTAPKQQCMGGGVPVHQNSTRGSGSGHYCRAAKWKLSPCCMQSNS